MIEDSMFACHMNPEAATLWWLLFYKENSAVQESEETECK
jgi:hypothetical protein